MSLTAQPLRFFFVLFLMMCLFLFSLGILLHRAFCVRTTIDRVLFPGAPS
jgi:hypothetical protein